MQDQAKHGEDKDDGHQLSSPEASHLIEFCAGAISALAPPPALDLLVVLGDPRGQGPGAKGAEGRRPKERDQQKDELQKSGRLECQGAIAQHGRIHGIHGDLVEKGLL